MPCLEPRVQHCTAPYSSRTAAVQHRTAVVQQSYSTYSCRHVCSVHHTRTAVQQVHRTSLVQHCTVVQSYSQGSDESFVLSKQLSLKPPLAALSPTLQSRPVPQAPPLDLTAQQQLLLVDVRRRTSVIFTMRSSMASSILSAPARLQQQLSRAVCPRRDTARLRDGPPPLYLSLSLCR